ncbi:MAG: GGDEF domain-containing protein [SAR324 cluster bacterium]|uniref:GGDEF domain-containing protein n=1 Tax=SAR324 cluster bacterium TaxID=2024889 RepID=A0A2A4T0Q1_9DELT|nr:MAG: GGDEF domain-containing protein [SAR324 cluster bacterium]
MTVKTKHAFQLLDGAYSIQGRSPIMTSKYNWPLVVKILTFAFQPIVSVRNGNCLGYEVLLRNWKEAGFTSIDEVFNQAFEDNYLYKLDLQLREKAIRNFKQLPGSSNLRLFYNLDNRVLEMQDYSTGNTVELLAKYDLPTSTLCFEISEKHDLTHKDQWLKPLHNYKKQHFQVAIDDYGTGFAGMKLLYQAEPNFVKIDRFFISDIAKDNKKRLFVSKIVELAHLMGISIIAEGVETQKEYYACKEIGCDFVQGYFIQRPMLDLEKLCLEYDHIAALAKRDQRKRSDDQWMISKEMKEILAIPITTDMFTVFEMFRQNKHRNFFPVVDERSTPLGMIHEQDLKEFVYSLYGKDLLQNRYSGKSLIDFIRPTPVADVTSPAEEILKIFTSDKDAEGIIVTRDTYYIGFLSARSLLNVLNAKNIAIARDQNPLTRLPGNHIIQDYVEGAIQDQVSQYTLVYFDFDNFKPFNDRFGFREGDRAIQMFADLLRKHFSQENEFIGHIGGDDFFVGFSNINFEESYQKVLQISTNFASSVESLYPVKNRSLGYIKAMDREGVLRRIPLLTVSAVILQLKVNHQKLPAGLISGTLAKMKKGAKAAADKICAASIAS